MKIAFRTDASLEIGTGHVMRCLTLASALRERGAECHFICREHPGNLLALIRKQAFEVVTLPIMGDDVQSSAREDQQPLAHAAWLGSDWFTDAEQTRASTGNMKPDWLIVDHYALDARWESYLRPYCNRILVIDDLADRPHDCDMLLNQNLIADMDRQYTGDVPDHCGMLLGPQYALLRPQYAELHPRIPPREGPVHRVMVYFGGVDSSNLTGMTISAFLSLNRKDILLDVVINPESSHAHSIRRQIEGHQNIALHSRMPTLALLMVQADVAIGAGGTTSWERCCLGLPALVITVAENQKSVSKQLEQHGAIRWLGHKDEVNQAALTLALKDVFDNGLMAGWSETGKHLVDGRGAQRVCSVLMLNSNTPLRPRLAQVEDESLILQWANDPLVRQNSFSEDTIDPITHHAWFRRCLRDLNGCFIYIVETLDGFPAGQVRFDQSDGAWMINYSLDPLARYRGLGKMLLQSAMLVFREINKGVPIFGRVKESNKVSCSVFESLGFTSENMGREIVYRYLLC